MTEKLNSLTVKWLRPAPSLLSSSQKTSCQSFLLKKKKEKKLSGLYHIVSIFSLLSLCRFLDVFTHLYKRLCWSVCLSVGMSVRLWVRLWVRKAFFFKLQKYNRNRWTTSASCSQCPNYVHTWQKPFSWIHVVINHWNLYVDINKYGLKVWENIFTA